MWKIAVIVIDIWNQRIIFISAFKDTLHFWIFVLIFHANPLSLGSPVIC